MQAIVCVDNNWGIGKDNKLLFHLPEDMAFFREKTLNKTVVMGRNTFQSLPDSRPLKNRTNIVLGENFSLKKPVRGDFFAVPTLEELFTVLEFFNTDDIFVIGGASIYEALLPYCSKVFLTRVDAGSDADRFFPNLDCLPTWSLESVSPTVEDNHFFYSSAFTPIPNLSDSEENAPFGARFVVGIFLRFF